MYDEHDLIYSPLQQSCSLDGHTVDIHIYRLPNTAWTLEVVDEYGNSTVWEEGFGTDQAAFDEAMRSMREDGIAALIGDPAEDAASTRSEPPALANCLSDDELAELNDFLLSDAVSDETMTLDQLDGYLTAIVVGPTCLNVSQWYVGIWGNRQEDVPHFLNLHHAQHVMQLILRHYNGIAASLEQGRHPRTGARLLQVGRWHPRHRRRRNVGPRLHGRRGTLPRRLATALRRPARPRLAGADTLSGRQRCRHDPDSPSRHPRSMGRPRQTSASRHRPHLPFLVTVSPSHPRTPASQHLCTPASQGRP